MDSVDETPGSKESSPKEAPNKSQIDFQFLNFSHPSEAKASGTRKAVRSHVTKQQHQREHAAAAARRAKSSSRAETDPDDAGAQATERSMTTESQSRSIVTATRTESSSPSSTPSGATSAMYRSENQLNPSDIYPEEWHPYLPHILVSTTATSYHSRWCADNLKGTLFSQHSRRHTGPRWT